MASGRGSSRTRRNSKTRAASLRELQSCYTTATRPELSFRALDAEVVPIAYFGPTLEAELQGQLQDFANQQKSVGKLGGIMVMVLETETNLTNVCPVGFGKDVLTLKTGQPWKEPLISTLNKGIVY